MFTCFDLLSKCFPAHFASAGPDLTPADQPAAFCAYESGGHPSTKFNPATKVTLSEEIIKKSEMYDCLFTKGGPYIM